VAAEPEAPAPTVAAEPEALATAPAEPETEVAEPGVEGNQASSVATDDAATDPYKHFVVQINQCWFLLKTPAADRKEAYLVTEAAGGNAEAENEPAKPVTEAMISDAATYLQSLNDTIADETPALIKAELEQINELLAPLNLSKEAADAMVKELAGDAGSSQTRQDLERVAVARAQLAKQVKHSNRISSLIKEREELKSNYLELKANSKKGGNVSALRRKKEKKLRDSALQLLIQKEEAVSQEIRTFEDAFSKKYAYNEIPDYLTHMKEDVALRLDEGKAFLTKGLDALKKKRAAAAPSSSDKA